MNLRNEIKKLSNEEKILLVEEIWDDIALNKEMELTDAQKTELRRRVHLDQEGKLKYLSLHESIDRIKSLKKNV